jgi:hypothetical protein
VGWARRGRCILYRSKSSKDDAASLLHVISFLRLKAKIEIRIRRLLRLLDERVQKHHPALMNAEQHSRDSALRQIAAHFPQPPAERPAQWHADRPGEFHVLDVFADDLPVDPQKALT